MANNEERAPFHLTPFLSERFQASGSGAKGVATPSHHSLIDPEHQLLTNPHQDSLKFCYGARQAPSGVSRATRRITSQHRGLQKMPNQHVGPYVWQSQQSR
jgi:hypothetical protein